MDCLQTREHQQRRLAASIHRTIHRPVNQSINQRVLLAQNNQQFTK